MSNENKEISEYLETSKTAVLATVDSNNNPNIRTIGGFGVKDITVYFSTAKKSNKVEQIKGSSNVSLLFEHENQERSNFVNIEVKGIAEEVKGKDQFDEGLKYIAKRRPQLKLVEDTHNIYRVVPKEIIILDFSKEKPEERIQKIEF
jgi:general stress protein 26